jgi:hypothetical protein
LVALLLASLLAQTSQGREPIAVLVASKRPGADASAAKVAARVSKGLTDEGLARALDPGAAAAQLRQAKLDPRACQGATPCLIKLAAALGPRAVVIGVDVGKIGKSLAVHLEAVAADSADTLGLTDFSASADMVDNELAVPIAAFLKEVAPRLGASSKSAAAAGANDAPKTAKLDPNPTGPQPSQVVSRPDDAPQKSARVLPWALGGGAVAAFAVSGTFAILGAQDKATFDASVVNGVSTMPASEWRPIQSRGNDRFTVALTSAVVGAALGAASAALFATGDAR